jgi:hypothetical protein
MLEILDKREKGGILPVEANGGPSCVPKRAQNNKTRLNTKKHG